MIMAAIDTMLVVAAWAAVAFLAAVSIATIAEELMYGTRPRARGRRP
jgi:hypothetical protein